jgi:serine/threonine-protein kinase
MGTAAYMSPEQAAGKTVDKRSDLWAFGVVLFEMLTGRRAFEGDDIAHVLAAVLKSEPDWASLPQDTPVAVRRLLRRCLNKDRRRRMADASDIRLELEEASAPTTDMPAPIAAPKRTPWLAMIGACVVVGLVTALTVWASMRPAPSPKDGIIRFVIKPPVAEPLNMESIWRSIAIAPDGSRLAYFSGSSVCGGQLMVKGLDEILGRPVAGAAEIRDPFFSPNGQWIGYMGGGGLAKFPIAGGTRIPIVDDATLSVRGASWGDDDTIVFGRSEAGAGLFRVSASGGTAVAITTPDAATHEGAHVFPSVLPNGRGVLFTIRADSANPVRVAVLDSQTGKYRTLIPGASNASYVQTGHLVFEFSGSLRVVPFDLATLKVTGDTRPVAERVAMTFQGEANYSVSRSGALAYVPARPAPPRSLVWIDRTGKVTPISGLSIRPYSTPRLSPDERKIAVSLSDENEDVWIFDLVRGGLTQLTNVPQRDDLPVWAPDSKSIVFTSNRTGETRLYRQVVDEAGEATPIDSPLRPVPTTITGNRHVLFHQNSGTRWALFDVALSPGAVPQPLIPGAGLDQQFNAAISPDGRYFAYNSSEAGNNANQVFIRPYPVTDTRRWQVSNTGGTRPFWSSDGRELFYLNQDNWVMVARVPTTGSPVTGVPTKLLDISRYMVAGLRQIDVSKDGQRFLVVKPEPSVDQSAATAHIVVVLNQFSGRLP